MNSSTAEASDTQSGDKYRDSLNKVDIAGKQGLSESFKNIQKSLNHSPNNSSLKTSVNSLEVNENLGDLPQGWYIHC
jgi:hypothetical protein